MGFFYLLNSVIELDEERGCKNSVKSLLPQMSTSHLQFKKNASLKLPFSPFVHQIDYLKKAEQAVRESEVRFKQIFEGSPIGIAAYDNDGCLLRSNKAYLDIFGISDDTEIKCLNLFEFPNITGEINGKIRTGNMVRFEAAFDFEKAKNLKCFKSEKSAVLHLDFIISPLGRQMPDSLLGYLLQIHDITKKKLMERQLIRSQKMASLGFLVSGIAH
jgi:PAS domain-containing protein